MSGGTGNGGTIVFGTSGFTARYKMIGSQDQSRGFIEDDDLASSNFVPVIPEDLAKSGEQELEVYFNAEAALPDITADPEAITVTLPQQTGQTAAASYTGSGFLTGRSLPKLANNEQMMSTIKIKYDHKGTAFAFTPATTS